MEVSRVKKSSLPRCNPLQSCLPGPLSPASPPPRPLSFNKHPHTTLPG
jgi:hypothetical protein